MTEEVRIVRGAVLATALVAPVALAVGGLAAGGRGVLGVAIGLALAAAFFSVTVVAVGTAGRIAPDLMIPVALIVFALKMLVVGLLLFLLRDVTAFDHAAFALAVVLGAGTYLAAEMRLVLRSRVPYVDVSEVGRRRAPVGLRSDEGATGDEGATREAGAESGGGPPTVSVEDGEAP
jgi:ATP synthase protein I